MPIPVETVTQAGSALVFVNTYGASVSEAYRGAVVAAENYLQAHFSNAVTIDVHFDMASLGSDIAAQNRPFGIEETYADLVQALRTHATTSDDLLAVNGLPLTDPSDGAEFFIPTAEARALGFLVGPSAFDLSVDLNSDLPWTFGKDAVGALIHEISEGAMGRLGNLGVGDGTWSPMDLFRFTANGTRDYTGGRDGLTTYFGFDSSHVTPFVYHNAIGADGVFDKQDLADWDLTFGDSFGPGGPGFPGAVSATDLRVLDILGWTPMPGAQAAPAADDYASVLADSTHPLGSIAVAANATGSLESLGDHDWFRVQLTGGTNYVITETGLIGGGGTLLDPSLQLHDSTGSAVASNDDALGGDTLDSEIVFHAGQTGTYYVDAGAWGESFTGTYTVRVQAGADAATSGDDFLVGDAAHSTITAGAGNDTITGADAQNYLRGEDGNDVITGGALFDDINGNKGDDTAHGGEGDDWVVGGQGNDVLYGDDGADIVYGNLGNDTCDGGFGNDLIRGGQGDDSLTGGDGNDWLSGDRGNDTLTGGAGADTFHTFAQAGQDVVTDFSASEGDRVQVDAGSTYTLAQVGADTVIDMGGGNEMILKNVQLAGLPTGWIFTL